MSQTYKEYHYEIHQDGNSEETGHVCHITPEGLSIEFRDGKSFQATVSPAEMFPDADTLDQEKQTFLVWFAKEKANGRWYSPEEMDVIYRRYKGDPSVPDSMYEELKKRPFDSFFRDGQ